MKDNELLFAKTRKNAIVPSKRIEDGCYDIYACFDEEEMVIRPHKIELIPTGIASAFSSKYRLAIRERGSNTKSTLLTVAGQIDSGYRGEIFIALYNSSDIPVFITKSNQNLRNYMKVIQVPYSKAIAQFAIEEVPLMEIKEISYEELKNIESERGLGCLGSSNK